MAKIKQKTIKKSGKGILDNKRIDALYKNIASYIHAARSNVLRTVNTEQVKAYWLIGRDIVEEEQVGEERAQYGAFLLQEISLRLTKEFGQGFGVSTLKDIRKFYWVYKDNPIGHAVRGQLEYSQTIRGKIAECLSVRKRLNFPINQF